jgi:hypothetical protein
MTGLEPATIAILVGTGVTAIGGIIQGINAERTANVNAKGLFDAAHQERLVGIENAKRQRRLASKRQGENRAFDPDKLDLLEDSAIEEELQVQTVVHLSETKAVALENRGRLEIARGQNERSRAMFGAFSSALIGFGLSGVNPFSAGATTAVAKTGITQFNPGNINIISGGGGYGSPLVLGT